METTTMKPGARVYRTYQSDGHTLSLVGRVHEVRGDEALVQWEGTVHPNPEWAVTADLRPATGRNADLGRHPSLGNA